MTASQIPVAATSSTVTSSEALAGSGAGIVTGPTSGTTAGHLVTEVGTNGQIQDGGTLLSALETTSAAQAAFSGTGACTNQVATTLNANSAPSCSTVTTAMIGTLAAGSNGLGTGAFATAYTLPTASSSVLGGVKPDGTSILNTSGAISVTPT